MISISIVGVTILTNAKPSTEPISNGYLNPILIDINVIIEKFNAHYYIFRWTYKLRVSKSEMNDLA